MKMRSRNLKNKRNNNYRVINLNIDTPSLGKEDCFAICPACDIAMIQASKDITDSGIILVNEGQHYCKQCGIILGAAIITTSKKHEQSGPRLAKNNRPLFKSIKLNQVYPSRSKLQQFFEDKREISRLSGQGMIVGTSENYY